MKIEDSEERIIRGGKEYIVIGIDVGVNTGIAVWSITNKKFINITSMSILNAFDYVLECKEKYNLYRIYIEDPRQVRYNTSKLKAQGAGSVKRDAGIWDEFVIRNGIKSIFVRPKKSLTKWKAETFKRFTGYEGRTNEHGRDAGMLVYKHK